jgi:MFS family permease
MLPLAACSHCKDITVLSRFGGLWRHPDFVRLWAGQTVSVFGSLVGGMALQFTAVLWLDATPLQLSLLLGCQFVPGFAVGLVAGAWVDRLHRRPILIAADIGRAVTIVTIPLAAVFDVLRIEQLYLVALVANSLTVFFDVAYEAYLPTLVEREELVEGNSKLTASASVAEFGAFSASGWLVQLLTGPGAILVDALSFVWSAVFVGRIRSPEPPPAPHHERQHIRHEIREGVQLVARTPILRSLAVTNLIRMLSGRMLGVVYLLYLNREVGFSPGVLGMIFAVGGLTSLAGAALAGRSSSFGGLGPALVLSSFLMSTGTLFMPLAASVSVVGVACLVMNQLISDPAWTFYDINSVSLRQAITPNRLLGRMNASIRFVEFGAMLAGTALGGVLGEVIGLRETLFLSAGGGFVAAAWLLFSPVARLRSMPVPPEVESWTSHHAGSQTATGRG